MVGWIFQAVLITFDYDSSTQNCIKFIHNIDQPIIALITLMRFYYIILGR